MVRCRHSPLIPTTASKKMKRPLVSEANTSISTDFSVGSVSRLTSTVSSRDVPTAAPARAAKVRVVRSLSSSACRSDLTTRPR